MSFDYFILIFPDTFYSRFHVIFYILQLLIKWQELGNKRSASNDIWKYTQFWWESAWYGWRLTDLDKKTHR